MSRWLFYEDICPVSPGSCQHVIPEYDLTYIIKDCIDLAETPFVSDKDGFIDIVVDKDLHVIGALKPAHAGHAAYEDSEVLVSVRPWRLADSNDPIIRKNLHDRLMIRYYLAAYENAEKCGLKIVSNRALIKDLFGDLSSVIDKFGSNPVEGLIIDDSESGGDGK